MGEGDDSEISNENGEAGPCIICAFAGACSGSMGQQIIPIRVQEVRIGEDLLVKRCLPKPPKNF